MTILRQDTFVLAGTGGKNTRIVLADKMTGETLTGETSLTGRTGSVPVTLFTRLEDSVAAHSGTGGRRGRRTHPSCTVSWQ